MDIPLTIKQTQDGLLTKRFSAVELVDAYLARIKAFDKNLNAFITVTEEKAYEDARKVDSLLLEHKFTSALVNDCPLLGVTVAYKDLYLTKGIRTTAASKVLSDYVPAYSATVVERIQKA